MSNTLMVFSPYVIDVPLAVGGLLANHTDAGARAIVVAMCYPGHPPRVVYPEVNKDSPYGRFKSCENYERTVARREVDDVVETLGLEKVITWDYEPNTDSLFGMEVVDKTTDVLNEYEPDVVVTYWPVSNYTDFTGCAAAVMRSMIERRLNKMPQVYFGETLTGRHTLCFTPNVYVDITDAIHKKKSACAKLWQGKNVDYFFNPFSLPVSQFRGRECGVAFAEAFVALHGSFGLEKKPVVGPAPDAHPVTMRRTVKRLARNDFGEGVQPKTYGVIDDETAGKVYGI